MNIALSLIDSLSKMEKKFLRCLMDTPFGRLDISIERIYLKYLPRQVRITCSQG